MYYIVSQSGQVAYGVKDFIADCVIDLEEIKDEVPGSRAYVVENQTYYLLSPQQGWMPEEGDGVKVPEPIEVSGSVLAAGSDTEKGWYPAELIAAGDKVFATSPTEDFGLSNGSTQYISGYYGKENHIIVVPRLIYSLSRGGTAVAQLGVQPYYAKKRGVFEGAIANTFVLPSYLYGSIPEYCFSKSNISELYILSLNQINIHDTSFEGCYFLTDTSLEPLKVYVPARLISTYQQDEKWQQIRCQFYPLREEDSRILSSQQEGDAALAQRITTLKERDVGIFANLTTEDFGVLAASLTTNNCVEISLLMINSAKATFEHHSAILYSWGVDVNNYCLTDGLTFRIPVTISMSAGYIILHLSQIELLNGYQYTGVGKAIVRTII